MAGLTAKGRRRIKSSNFGIPSKRIDSPDGDPVELVFTLLWPRAEARTPRFRDCAGWFAHLGSSGSDFDWPGPLTK